MIIYSASEANNSLLNRLLSSGSGLSAEGNALRLNVADSLEQIPPLAMSPQQPHAQPTMPSLPVVPNMATLGNNNTGPTFELSTPNDVQFTVGSFAMTRFGTTKVKNSPAALKYSSKKNFQFLTVRCSALLSFTRVSVVCVKSIAQLGLRKV